MHQKARTLIRMAALTGLSLMTLMAAIACLAGPVTPPVINRTTQPLGIDFTEETSVIIETTETIPLIGATEASMFEPASTTAAVTVPTESPTSLPTLAPTLAPTPLPTVAPTCTPTPRPTAAPTHAPTCTPVPTTPPSPTPAGGCQIFLPGIDYTGWEMDAAEMAKARELIRLVNEARQANPGNPLPELVEGSPEMWKSASIRAVEIKTKFQHVRPTDDRSSDGWYELYKGLGGCAAAWAGENITGIDSYAQSPQEAFDRLWAALTNGVYAHRDNMMYPEADKVAIGVFTSGGTDWYVQFFLADFE